MSDAEFSQRIVSVSVFARIMPAQKLHIVWAIKADDQVVAMTGDGVNGAPAPVACQKLKCARFSG